MLQINLPYLEYYVFGSAYASHSVLVGLSRRLYCTLHTVVNTFCNSNRIILYDLQLLDAVMNVIEPAGRFHRSEVSYRS